VDDFSISEGKYSFLNTQIKFLAIGNFSFFLDRQKSHF